MLAAEIAKKRKKQEEAKVSVGGGVGPRKWLKRGEVEQLRVAQYHEDEALAAEELSVRPRSSSHRSFARLVQPQRRLLVGG